MNAPLVTVDIASLMERLLNVEAQLRNLTIEVAALRGARHGEQHPYGPPPPPAREPGQAQPEVEPPEGHIGRLAAAQPIPQPVLHACSTAGRSRLYPADADGFVHGTCCSRCKRRPRQHTHRCDRMQAEVA